MDPNGDPEVHRVWSLLSEVSEQLSQNRSSAVNLHALAEGAKTQAIHSQTGFVLRRFNLDKPKEVYDAELERMNASMSAENQTLLNDNRQLSTLIREYELTLENVMETFRTRAHEVQQRELALMRQYETLIIARETELTESSLSINSARSESLARAGRMLRAVMRRLAGEDVGVYDAYVAHTQATPCGKSGEHSSTSDMARTALHAESEMTVQLKLAAEADVLENGKGKARDDEPQSEDGETEDEADGSQDEESGDDAQDEVVLPERNLEVDRILDEEDDPDKRLAVAEWSLERESELARLECENEELRALVNGLLKATPEASTARDPTSSSSVPEHPECEDEHRSSDHPSYATLPRPSQQRQLGGLPGRVGPFGTYKKSTAVRLDNR